MEDQIVVAEMPAPKNTGIPHKQQPPSYWERNKVLLKGMFITVLTLLLLIPQSMLQSLVNERKERLNTIAEQIAVTNGGPQTITGPILAIPYKKLSTSSDGKKNYFTKAYAYIMPETLVGNTSLEPDSKRVSIFNVSTYNSITKASGSYKNCNWQKLGIADGDVCWDEARLLIGISDYRGLVNTTSINWDGVEYTTEAGFTDKGVLQNALQASIPISSATLSGEHKFSYSLALRGTAGIHFVPVGNQTTYSLDTKWKTPRFVGNYPAKYNEDFASKPLHASWTALGINRNFPQIWKDENKNLASDYFGMDLLQPIVTYAKTLRSVKYGLLIIALTFIIYFFTELLQKKTAHIFQYGLVGFALIVFYLLLLSIAEYTGFHIAYIISALATIMLIGLYTKSIFHDNKTAMVFTGFLSMLYLFIFLLIQLEDGALLIGSIGLFIVVAAIMYLSKKINWYASGLDNG
jgi:inner membrane protein